MSDHRASARRAAISGLRRIRAVESAPDEDGIRTVWHQGQKGAELVSWVRADGRLMRQELILLADHFQWSGDVGLRSGEVSQAPGSKAGPASGNVAADAQLRPDRIFRAVDALSAWDGDDRYVLHIKRVLELTADGLESTGESTVTRAALPPADAQEAPRLRDDASGGGLSWPMLLAAALALIVGAGLLLWAL